MKNFYLTLLAIGLAHSSTSQTWMQENSGTNNNMSAVGFATNDLTGWSFGDSSITGVFQYGSIYKTSNQGYSWQEQNMGSDSIQILACQVFSTTTVIAVGKYQTTGDGAVIKTVNGGVTWVLDTTTTPERLFDLSFPSPNTGWIVGRNGYVGNSIDAGANWSTQTTGTAEDIFGISFSSTTNGWAVGADGGSGGTIIHTLDAGSTWNAQTTTSTGDLFSVYSINNDTAYAVGAGGIILFTGDAGATWGSQTSGTSEDLFDVEFSDALNGRAVGANGTILITSDAGIAWTTETSNTTNDIKDLFLGSNGMHWYSGISGDIYIYATVAPNTIAENEFLNVRAFPNPTNGIFNLNLESELSYDIYIYQFDGKLVQKETALVGNSELNIEYLNQGLYLFVIYNENIAIGKGQLIKQ